MIVHAKSRFAADVSNPPSPRGGAGVLTSPEAPAPLQLPTVREHAMYAKTIAGITVGVGLLLVGIGCLEFASNAIPLQDATPEQTAQQSDAAETWGLAMAAGAALVAAGLAMFLRLFRRRVQPRE